MSPTVRTSPLAPDQAVGWYRRNRARTRALFDLVDPAAYYSRPIRLRNPIVFYEGHLPAFSVIAFIKRGLGQPGIQERLEELFARGIDPEDEASAVPRSGPSTAWPSRDEVLAYGRAVDELVVSGLSAGARPDPEAEQRRAEGLYTALEHEAMHQETLLYMWHELPLEQKRRPRDYRVLTGGAPPDPFRVPIPAGRVRLGAQRHDLPFGWDNEFPACETAVDAFEIDAHNVTNAQYLEFVEEGAAPPHFWVRRGTQWFWRGMFDEIPLPPAWPVYVTQEQAAAFAARQGGRLPTEAEYHRAAYGAPDTTDERAHPWGDTPADATRGNFDFLSYDPMPTGSFPQGASAFGVQDLVGNGWEWTSSIFEPFPGFQPMPSYPEYSADFFDGQHVVMKGASPVTARELVRRSFRNWFRPNYPYVFATFRCVYR
jgi:gamma-glutamyl hercynylcysteine S-oxide synthase